MAKLKTAAQICEMLLLVAGIALLCSTEGLQSGRKKTNLSDGGESPEDYASWGIGA